MSTREIPITADNRVDSGRDPGSYTGKWWPWLLGCFLLLLGALLIYLLVLVWPAVQAVAAGDPAASIAFFGVVNYTPPADTAYLILVIVASSLGSYVHLATSFATFVGNRRFEPSWFWWYVLRVFIGIALALVFYFALRGGFLITDTPDLNPYGVAALAGLVGLFSKQATDKLSEIFTVAFSTPEGHGDDERKDKLDGK